MFVGFGQPGCDLARDLQSFLYLQPGAILSRSVDAFVECHGDEQVPAGVSSISWITTILG